MSATSLEAQIKRAEAFRALHAGPEILVLANGWDVGSCRLIESAGFPAVATTSSGVAWSLGHPDGERVTRNEMLDVVRRIANAIAIPLSADMESGYGKESETVAETTRLTIEAGAVGMNLEDSDPNDAHRLLGFDLSVERIRAAKQASERAGVPLVINARIDAFFPTAMTNGDRFDEAVKRANAYRSAGAASLFVPFVTDAETIGKLVRAIDGPLNVLAMPATPPVSELKKLGVARVTIGGSLATVAWTAVKRSLDQISAQTGYGTSSDTIPTRELNRLFTRAKS